MNKIFKIIFLSFIPLLLIYLIASFYNQTFNVYEWTKETIGYCTNVLCALASLTTLIIFFYIIGELKSNDD